MTALRALFAAALLGLAACTSADIATLGVADADEPRYRALLADPGALRAYFADTTVRTWSEDHGTQIEYHSADGQTWLVYPGNMRAVRGRWEIRGPAGNPRICYLYGPNTYNPVLDRPGGRWNCWPAAFDVTAKEVVDGDVLRLRGRERFPRPLPAGVNLRLDTVMREVGLGPRTGPNKSFLEGALP